MAKVSEALECRQRASSKAARIATGEKHTRLLDKRRIDLRNASNNMSKYYWGLIRSAIKEKKLDMYLGIAPLEDDDAYLESLTIKQGFRLKHTIQHDQSLLMADHHSSLIRNSELSVSDDDIKDESSKMKPFNLIAFDRLHRMVFWEIKQIDKVICKGAFKGVGDVSHFVFLPKSGIFVICYLDKVIKFYDVNLGYISDFLAPHSVQFLRYSENKNTLILIGIHEITIYSISGLALRDSGVISRDSKIELLLLNEFHTPYVKEHWIKAVVLQEKTFQLSIAIGTNLVVYDYRTGKIIENITNATERPITCIQYHHFYGYTLLGTTSGQSKILFD
jgi:WD40 repeat protein